MTVAAIGILVYAIANILHEGLGHGGACLIVGGKARVLTSTYFDCDTAGLPGYAVRLVSAGGTLVNLVVAAVALVGFRTRHAASVSLHYFTWLLGTVNLLQGAGYFLYSGVANIGDWASVVKGATPWWLWNPALAVFGGAAYWFCVSFTIGLLGPFIGGEGGERVRRAYRLTLVPYFVGAGLYCVAGLLNPIGAALVAASAAAASLGGTSGLIWGPQLLRGDRIPLSAGNPMPILPSVGWILAAAIVALPFVAVLGPGIRIR